MTRNVLCTSLQSCCLCVIFLLLFCFVGGYAMRHTQFDSFNKRQERQETMPEVF